MSNNGNSNSWDFLLKTFYRLGNFPTNLLIFTCNLSRIIHLLHTTNLGKTWVHRSSGIKGEHYFHTSIPSATSTSHIICTQPIQCVAKANYYINSARLTDQCEGSLFIVHGESRFTFFVLLGRGCWSICCSSGFSFFPT